MLELLNPLCICKRGYNGRILCGYVYYHSICSSVDLYCPNMILIDSAQQFKNLVLTDFSKSTFFESYCVIYLSDYDI